MNTLSWLIYFSGISSGIAAVTGFAGAIFIAISFLVSMYHIIELSKPVPRIVYKLLSLAGVFIAISVLMPRHETIMYIAASEYGEKIIKNQSVKEFTDPALDLLKKWIESEAKRISRQN